MKVEIKSLKGKDKNRYYALVENESGKRVISLRNLLELNDLSDHDITCDDEFIESYFDNYLTYLSKLNECKQCIMLNNDDFADGFPVEVFTNELCREMRIDDDYPKWARDENNRVVWLSNITEAKNFINDMERKSREKKNNPVNTDDVKIRDIPNVPSELESRGWKWNHMPLTDIINKEDKIKGIH